jgi:uncharacterized protein YqgC (DUF456 family)
VSSEALWILGIVLVLTGLAGVVLPGLPGVILVFAGLALVAWGDGFTRVGIFTVVLLGCLAVASYAIDLVAAAFGVKRMGASRRAMAGAMLGTALGLFFGLPGVIVGPFAGAVIGELTTKSSLGRASRVGLAAWIGFLFGTAAKIGVAFLMIGIFLVALLW